MQTIHVWKTLHKWLVMQILRDRQIICNEKMFMIGNTALLVKMICGVTWVPRHIRMESFPRIYQWRPSWTPGRCRKDSQSWISSGTQILLQSLKYKHGKPVFSFLCTYKCKLFRNVFLSINKSLLRDPVGGFPLLMPSLRKILRLILPSWCGWLRKKSTKRSRCPKTKETSPSFSM